MKKRLVILSGAGVSAESGIRTFRDNGGLWEEHSIQEVATPEAWERDPELVLRFYNQRRSQLATVEPNNAHRSIAQLEDYFDVDVITQNVDDLHERGGSSKVMHLHGELTKVRSSMLMSEIKDIGYADINIGDRCSNGAQLRPHIVWFGEAVPMIEEAVPLVSCADVIVVIGTSMNVYPAAGLVDMARRDIPIFLIDPDPELKLITPKRFEVMRMTAGKGMPLLAERLVKEYA